VESPSIGYRLSGYVILQGACDESEHGGPFLGWNRRCGLALEAFRWRVTAVVIALTGIL